MLSSLLAIGLPPKQQSVLAPQASGDCPVGCKSVAATVHGDPMFKINGTGTHFWLKEGDLTPLLTSGEIVLSGKTFSRQDTGHQWFDQFVLSKQGKAVLDVATADGKIQVKLNGKGVSTGKLNANGMDVEFDSKGIKAKAGTLAITIYSSQATKFASGTDQAKYEHLNINFEGGIPTDAEGIFAELSGVKAMSEATAALLKHPEGIPAAGALVQKASGCVCTFNVNLTAPVKTYYATNALECNAETVGSQICGSQFDRPVAGDFSIAFKFRQTPAQSAAQPIEANDGSQPQDQTEIVQGTAWYYGGGLVDCEMPGAQNDWGISTGNGHVFFGIGSVDGPAHTIGSGGGYDDGEWHEVIATREQSSGNSALYIDDLLVGTKTDGTKNDLDSATSMRIGKLQTNINPFYGEIKSVAIYNSVVSKFPPLPTSPYEH